MKIKVLFFAQLREIFGADEKEYEISEGTSVEAFVQLLIGQGYEQLRKINLSFAINEDWVTASEPLKPQDRLALLPPVAGG